MDTDFVDKAQRRLASLTTFVLLSHLVIRFAALDAYFCLLKASP